MSEFNNLIGGVIADVIIIPAHYGLDGVPDIHELHIELDSGVKLCIDIAGNGELTNWAELNIEVKENDKRHICPPVPPPCRVMRNYKLVGYDPPQHVCECGKVTKHGIGRSGNG